MTEKTTESHSHEAQPQINEVKAQRRVTVTPVEKRHKPDYTGAIILIFIGLVFLLNNFGIVTWEIWGTLWRFWPIFPIIWGLQLVFGKSTFANIAIAIITIVLLAIVLIASAVTTDQRVEMYVRDQLQRIERQQ